MKRRKKQKIGKGVVLMREVADAMRAEKVLKKEGFDVRLVAPPPHLREGCDLAVEVEITERLAIERALKEHNTPFLRILPLTGQEQPVDVVSVVDFGREVMVRSANMKMTFDKTTGTIVNISGGGCPDIPYLYSVFVGRNLLKVAAPKDVGTTLCALMLHRAYEECKRIFAGEERC